MNQAVTFNFAIAKESEDKNVRAYQFIVMPGAPWEEVYEVLEEFIAEIKKIQAAELERAREVSEAESAKNAAAIEPEVLEPEIVSPV